METYIEDPYSLFKQLYKVKVDKLSVWDSNFKPIYFNVLFQSIELYLQRQIYLVPNHNTFPIKTKNIFYGSMGQC